MDIEVSEEDIEKFLNNIPRQKKIERMLGQVEGWDLESLIDWIQYELNERYVDLDDEDLNSEYYSYFDDEIHDDVYDELEAAEEARQAALPKTCQCPNLFIMGHEDGCPEKRS